MIRIFFLVYLQEIIKFDYLLSFWNASSHVEVGQNVKGLKAMKNKTFRNLTKFISTEIQMLSSIYIFWSNWMLLLQASKQFDQFIKINLKKFPFKKIRILCNEWCSWHQNLPTKDIIQRVLSCSWVFLQGFK